MILMEDDDVDLWYDQNRKVRENLHEDDIGKN